PRPQDGRTVGKHPRGKQVWPLLDATRIHSRIIRRAFSAAVPTPIIVGAVAVLLPIRLVMLLVVADQIAQGEPIVRSHKIDAGIRPASAALVEIARPGHAIGELANQPTIAFPVRAYAVTIPLAPLVPRPWKFAALVAA